MNLAEAKHHLSGPIMSVRTVFDKDGEIDFEGTMRLIDRSIGGGSRTIMLTAGDSHYICLDNQEIAELTKRTCAHVGKRAMVIAADRFYSTNKAVAFAEYCKDVGADMYMACPPDWGHSCTPQSFAEHYAAIANVLPVMIVTNVFIPRGRTCCLETIEMAAGLSENILAVKDDLCGDAAHDISGRFHDKLAIVAGGQKRNHMNMLPWGVDGYLSLFVTFNPAIAQTYWNAIERNDLTAATRIVLEQDIPFFDFVDALPGGFDSAVHSMLEIYNIAGRYRRKPYHTSTDEEVEKLTEFLASRNLL